MILFESVFQAALRQAFGSSSHTFGGGNWKACLLSSTFCPYENFITN